MNPITLLQTKLGAKLGRNVGSTLAAQGISWVAALAVTFFLPAYLGDTGLGMLTLATTFAGTLAVVMNFGTSTVLVREIARYPERTGELVRTALLLRLLLGVVLSALGIAAVFALGYKPDLRVLVILCILSTVTGQLGDVLQSALRGREEFPVQNAAALAEKLFICGATIALVFLKAPIWSFIALYFAGVTISSAICWRRLRTLMPPGDLVTVSSPRPNIHALAVAGLPFVASMLFISIYGDGSSALLMSKLSTLAAIGWFGFAKRIAGAAQMIPVAVAGALLPVLSRLHAEGKPVEFGQTVRRMAVGMLACALPFSLVLILAPGFVLDILHYPESFRGSIPVLRVTGGAMILWFLQQAIGTALIACDRQVVFSRVTAIAALLAFPVSGAGIWLGERLMQNGAVGAMTADAVLELFMLTSYALALPKGTLFPSRDAEVTAPNPATEVAA